MKKKKYKLESVSITVTYDTSGDDYWIVTEHWIPRKGTGTMDDYDYKYQASTFESAKKIAQMRIDKYGN